MCLDSNKLVPGPSQIFTGREDYLETLQKYFGPSDDHHEGRRDFLLYGVGGIGKTQICLKFVEEMSDQ
jgi:Cdc6-like AAA superfamily ATPase